MEVRKEFFCKTTMPSLEPCLPQLQTSAPSSTCPTYMYTGTERTFESLPRVKRPRKPTLTSPPRVLPTGVHYMYRAFMLLQLLIALICMQQQAIGRIWEIKALKYKFLSQIKSCSLFREPAVEKGNSNGGGDPDKFTFLGELYFNKILLLLSLLSKSHFVLTANYNCKTCAFHLMNQSQI